MRKLDSCCLIRAQRVDHEIARCVECKRSSDHVGIAGDPRLESILRLRVFLLGEPETLASCNNLLIR